ncbi:serine protease [Vibrio sp. SCSIO 43136]|uniref:S1 family peptidase n=1 Tax=Vibrio sp. SCSIO 43136 TaxID=2819101 RepID=UPI002075EA0F|nr:serine protease [Vibrio sp. SCSIO 43136]USD68064.1 serine protease [Vibrio sp. SCSIO 43136]
MKCQLLLASLIGCALSGAASATDEVSTFIINGTDATASNYPYFASLYYDTRWMGGYAANYCGATIIDANHVLTAAHCVTDDSVSQYTRIAIQVQSESNPDAVETAWASEFYRHPDYVDSSSVLWPNDIAIIKLATPLSTAGIAATLGVDADKANYSNSSTNFTIIGHGDTWHNGVNQGDDNDSLEETTVSYYVGCTEPGAVETPTRAICVQGAIVNGARRSGCNGDSGGPLIWQDTANSQTKVVGITSYGATQCGTTAATISGVYTEIATYTDWINGIVNGSSSQQPDYTVTTDGRTDASYDTTSGGAGSLGVLALLGLVGFGALRRR